MMKSPVLFAAMALAACQPAAPAPEAEAPVVAEVPDPSQAMDFSMPFTVKVVLSEAAAAELAATGERITVDAYYYGAPKDETVAAEVGPGDPGVWLGTETLIIEGAEPSTVVPGEFENAIAVEKVGDGGVRALVNVYSAREKSADNRLSCGILDESLEVLGDAPDGHVINCDLIEE